MSDNKQTGSGNSSGNSSGNGGGKKERSGQSGKSGSRRRRRRYYRNKRGGRSSEKSGNSAKSGNEEGGNAPNNSRGESRPADDKKKRRARRRRRGGNSRQVATPEIPTIPTDTELDLETSTKMVYIYTHIIRPPVRELYEYRSEHFGKVSRRLEDFNIDLSPVFPTESPEDEEIESDSSAGEPEEEE